MAGRDTSTGSVLEHMVLPALQRGGYRCDIQVNIGMRPGGRRHFVDAIVERDGRRLLVSLKWQQTGGTAEQKVPFEVICLAEALLTDEFQGAYLVLGGCGWSLRDFYTRGGLRKYIVNSDRVIIMGLEDFIARANQGEL